MWSTYIIIVSLLLRSILIVDIDGATNLRRHRRQTSGSLYGINAHLGSSAPAGYNYPSNTNIEGVRLNNPDARGMHGNPMRSSSNTGNSLQSINLYDKPRPQQEQLYGISDQSALNALYSGSGLYYGTGANPFLPQAPVDPSFYSSSNTQMNYPPDPNQVLANKDFYGTSSNKNNNEYAYNSNIVPNRNTYGRPTSSNGNIARNPNTYDRPMGTNNNMIPNPNTYGRPIGTNNNMIPNPNTYGRPMGTNNNMIPNPNTYGGPMGSNGNIAPNPNAYGGTMDTNKNMIPNRVTYGESISSNSNMRPNRNTYGGSMGSGNSMIPNSNIYSRPIGSNGDIVPNRNTYSGSMGTNMNKNSWLNTNYYNRYNQNSANSRHPNKDDNSYNSNRYGYSNSYYNDGYQLTTSCVIIFFSFFATILGQP